jgi:hypothetical protein
MMPYFLLMLLRERLVAHLFWILLVWTYQLGQSYYSAFTAHHYFRVSPSARCVSAVSTICRSIDMFSRDCTVPSQY